MTVNELREILEGTGATILEAPTPCFLFQAEPFRILPNDTKESENVKETFVKTQMCGDDDWIRAKFGGRQLVAYDTRNFTKSGGVGEISVVRVHVVPNEKEKQAGVVWYLDMILRRNDEILKEFEWKLKDPKTLGRLEKVANDETASKDIQAEAKRILSELKEGK